MAGVISGSGFAAARVAALACFCAGWLWPGTLVAGGRDGGEPRLELFSGGDLTGNSGFGYSGGVWAPGTGLYAPGFRLRVLAGYGAYSYGTTLAGVPVGIDGRVVSGEVMAGYLWRRGEWTVKAYGGVHHADHDLAPGDPANSVSGGRTGVKLQTELWRNIGSKGFLSLDGSWSSAFSDYWAQGRLGRRVRGRLSAGVEAGALGNEEYNAGRGGGFLRFHFRSGDITVSGGVTGDYLAGDASGYVTLGLRRTF